MTGCWRYQESGSATHIVDDFVNKFIAELAQLVFANAADGHHGGFIGGHSCRHLCQGGVTKDDERRNPFRIGQPLATHAQSIKKLIVVIEITDLRTPFLLQGFDPKKRGQVYV